MQKSILVTNKEARASGVKNNTAWTIYEITDNEGVKYSTFNGGLYDVGNEYEVEVEMVVNEKNGKKYQNFRLQDNPRKGDAPRTQGGTKLPEKPMGKTASPETPLMSDILATLKRIEEKIDKMSHFVGAEI